MVLASSPLLPCIQLSTPATRLPTPHACRCSGSCSPSSCPGAARRPSRRGQGLGLEVAREPHQAAAAASRSPRAHCLHAAQVRRWVLDGRRPELPSPEALRGPGVPTFGGLDAYCQLIRWGGAVNSNSKPILVPTPLGRASMPWQRPLPAYPLLTGHRHPLAAAERAGRRSRRSGPTWAPSWRSCRRWPASDSINGVRM